MGAAVTAGGDEKTGKALAMIQGIKEKKRDRAALKERNTSDIDAFHTSSSLNGKTNDNYG